MERQVKELTVEASLDNLNQVMGFIEDSLGEAMCPIKVCMQIVLCIEEVFVNIASYAYENEKGSCKISIDTQFSETEGKTVIVMEDMGRKFNPLEKEDPDITLSADERQIGGLGIFIVKKTMDSVEYSYENKNNILKMEKSWNT